SNQQPDLAGKRLEILREIVPGLSRLAVLANGHSPTPMLNVGEVPAGAPQLTLEVNTLDLRAAGEIPARFRPPQGRRPGTLWGGRSLGLRKSNTNDRGGAGRGPAEDAQPRRI